MVKRSRLYEAKRFLCCGFVFISAALAMVFGLQSAYADEMVSIDEGVYEIRAQVSDKALDIAGASFTDRANAQMFEANSTAAQYWRIEKSGEHYAIRNSLTGIALDVAAAGMDSGTNVQVYGANGTPAQQWDFISDGNGSYEIRSALNGLVLDVAAASTNNGANVQVYTRNGTVAQKWTLNKYEPSVSDGVYVISSMKNASTVLDVSNASLSDRTKIQAWSANQSLAQKWEVTYSDSTGFYTVRSAQSGKALDIADGNPYPGASVQQFSPNGTPAQGWRIASNDDGSYTIYSVLNNLALDLSGGSVADGTRVQTWDPNGTAAQRWTFEATSLISDGLYQVESALDSQRVLDVSGGSLDEWAQHQVWFKNDSLAQKWLVTKLDNSLYSIKNAKSGFYLADSGNGLYGSRSSAAADAQWSASVGSLGGITFVNGATEKAIDLSYGNTAVGAAVSTFSPNKTAAQAWRLASVNLINDGYYFITNRAAPHLALDVDHASKDPNARVQVWDSNGTDAQKWLVKSEGDGWYTITSANSNLLLDVVDASTASGTNLQQFRQNYSNAQYWHFSVGSQGGVTVTSKLGDLCMTARGDHLESGNDAIVATPQDNSSFGWLFEETTFTVAAPDIWGDSSYVERMRQKAISIGSSTDWFCTVDKAAGRTVVFKRIGGTWSAVKTTNVVTSGNTFTGSWEVVHKARGYWKEPDCYNVNDWWVCFVEAWSDDYNGHLRYDASAGAYDDGQGFHYGYSSGGCTAIPDYDIAKWLYDNVAIGSRVVVF